MPAMLEALDTIKAGNAGRGRKGCPPHGPHLIEVVESSSYAARCLTCGLVGPKRKDSLGAKLAFDQRWH
jgi:hypothetical protein